MNDTIQEKSINWNNVVLILLIVLIVINCLLLFGILFNWEGNCYLKCFIPSKLIYLYQKGFFNFINVITSLGALIGFLILHLRNIAMTKQTKSQGEIFHKDKQFKNFLEATELLTNKDATVEAKISAMFLLHGVAINYPEDSERVIQVINKQLTPLIKCTDNDCEKKKYSSHLKEKRILKSALLRTSLNRIETFDYTENQLVTIDVFNDNRVLIKEWQYKGNDTEKVISTALFIIKKIILNLPESNNHLDISNTIIFDIDTKFDKEDINKGIFVSKKRPIENLIFFQCTFKKVKFNETKYSFCKFIDCVLEECSFEGANLWRTLFANCDLKDVVFNQAECEGVEFRNCENLTSTQLNRMKFENKERSNKKYLIIVDKNTNIEIIKEEEYFNSEKEYNKWKNDDKN